MTSKKFTLEQFLYLLILALALAIRLLNLNLVTLDPGEAAWALRAHQAADGTLVNTGVQPAYVLLSGLLFNFFGSSAALARLLPALCGALLVLLPYQLRGRLGQLPALIFALGLAFDPGLVALSRQAGGPMMAVAFTLLALTSWQNGAVRWAGVFLGLSLLSGPAAIYGWLLLALLWAVLSLRGKYHFEFTPEGFRSAGIGAAVTIVLAGTLFLRYPQGISGIGSALWSFLQGFGQFSGRPLLEILLTLFSYQPLALAAAAYAWYITREQLQPSVTVLKTAVGIAFAFILLYPARQIGHLAWLLVPLWALAAVGLSRLTPWRDEQRSPVMWSEAALTMVLAVLFWINLSAVSKLNPINLNQAIDYILKFKFGLLPTLDIATQNFLARGIALALVPVLSLLAMLLVGMGWDLEDARRGFVIGLLACLGAYTFSISWGAAHLPERHANELWYDAKTSGDTGLMLDTIGDLAEWQSGQRQTIEILSLSDDPALKWALRHFPDVSYNIQLPPNELPSLVITPAGVVEPRLEQAYRGQSFALMRERLWRSWPPDLLPWLVYRQAPTAPQEVILWARVDLFPEGAVISAGDSQNTDQMPDIIPEP